MLRARHRRRVGEPEGAAGHHAEAERVDPDRGVFAGGLAVIAADADLLIAMQPLLEFVELEAQCLLKADQVRRMVADQGDHVPAPIRPGVVAIAAVP